MPVVKPTVRPSLSVPFLPSVLSPAHAAVVLALPSVATIMPHQPAEAERKAPLQNETATAVAVVIGSSVAVT